MTSIKTLIASISVVLATAAGTQAHAKVRPEYLTLGGGVTGLFDAHTGAVYSGEMRFTPWFWQLRPFVLASITGDEAFQAGAGLAYEWQSTTSPWTAAIGFAPGYYNARNGKDLGGNYQNMSFIEGGYRFEGGNKVTLRFSHLSNGGLRTHNPGTDRLTLNYSIPLAR